jgi:hypothetical protein
MTDIPNESSGIWVVACVVALALPMAALGCSSTPGTAVPGGGGSDAARGQGAGEGGSGGAAAGSGAAGSGAAGSGAAGSGAAGSGAAAGGAAAGGGGAMAGAGGGTGALGGTGGTTGTGGEAGTGTGANCLHGDVDVRSTTLSGTITANGGPLTAIKGYVSVALHNAAGDAVFLGSSSPYAIEVIPGSYDVYYTWSDPDASTVLVTKSPIKIRSGIVVGTTPRSLDIDVPLTAVAGTFTVKGATITTWERGDCVLWLRSAAGEDVELSTTTTGTFSALVVPGSYDLYYREYRKGPAVPTNASAKVKSGLVVGASPASFSIDVPATPVSGAVTFNGAKLAGSDKGSYGFTLRNAAGDSAQLTSDLTKGSFSGLVVPGTYDLYYTYYSAGGVAAVPRNQSGKVRSGIVVGTSPLSLDIDVPATTVSVTATINGSAASAPIGDALVLRDAAGDTVGFSGASDSLSTLAIPGTYDLFYVSPSRAGLPDNRSAKLRSGIVLGASPLTLDLDISTTTVSGSVAINGAKSSDTEQGAGTLALRADNDSVPLAYTNAGSYSKVVIAGTYELVYATLVDGPAVPANKSAKLKQGIVVGTSPVSLDIDVPTTVISGSVTVNGAPVSGSGAAALTLYGASGDMAVIAGVSATNRTYSTLVVPGSYELRYGVYNRDPAIPGNSRANLGCFTVAPAVP